MPRKVAINIHDALVKFCMQAPLAEVTGLLKVATSIVSVRAQGQDVPLPGLGNAHGKSAARSRALRPPVTAPASTTQAVQTALAKPGPTRVETPKPPAPSVAQPGARRPRTTRPATTPVVQPGDPLPDQTTDPDVE